MRTWSLRTSSSSARSSRTSNGTCVETHTVNPPSPSGATAIAFGSMGTGATRWFTNRPRATTSEPARTSSSHRTSNASATLLPWSGHSSGASSATAASTSVTAASGSRSGRTISAASWPTARDSATTSASGSPTNRTTSRAITSRPNGPSSVPEAPSTLPLGGIGTDGQIVCGVDRDHPGHGPRGIDVHRDHARVRHHGANEHRPEHALDREVLEVPAAARQEPWVFRTQGRLAEHRGRQRGHGLMLPQGVGPPAASEGESTSEPSEPARS